MVNNQTIRFRIRPYALEATLELVIEVVCLLLALVTFSYLEAPPLVWVDLVAFCFVFGLFLTYRVFIQANLDNLKKDYITETIQIKKFDVEYSFAGDRLGYSHIRLFYPKDMDVQRYKIIVIDHNGKQKKIRSVMSSYRKHKLFTLFYPRAERLKVTYLRRSKILIYVELAEEIFDCKQERKVEIDKAIRAFNRSE